MKEEIQQTKTLLADLVLTIHRFIAENISDHWEVQVLIKFLMLFGIVIALDLLIKMILLPIFSSYRDGEKYPFLKAVHTSGITRSVANIIALLLGNILFTAFFSVYHKETFSVLHRVYNVVAIVAVARMGLRAMKAVENYFFFKKDYYKIVALKAISETLKTIGIFIFIVVLISVIFGIQGTTILGSLGAITAVLVLVFRDTILGFMTSLHVATSKNLKVGDWIGIPKYNLEGTIEEINLLTTKIQNFDKTKSTIPTYDLLSTEIKNMQVMSESNTRRIKRSISFNIKSFRFLSPEDIEKLSKINLVADYLKIKKEEIAAERAGLQNSDLLINGRQLTNIGVFREYTFNYLKNSAHIDQEGTLMVRQLENTPQGMPLEIYCFTNDSVWVNYEEIQSDIFDHLLVASREFDLEVMQFTKI